MVPKTRTKHWSRVLISKKLSWSQRVFAPKKWSLSATWNHDLSIAFAMKSSWQAYSLSTLTSSTKRLLVCVWVNSPWWQVPPDPARQPSWVSSHWTSYRKECQLCGVLSKFRTRFLLNPWSSSMQRQLQRMRLRRSKRSKNLSSFLCTCLTSMAPHHQRRSSRPWSIRSWRTTSASCASTTYNSCYRTRHLETTSSTFKTK